MPWSNYDGVLASLKWSLAGLFGALAISRLHRSEFERRRDFIIFVISGALTARYLTGLVAHYAGIDGDNANAVAFLIGAFGGSIFQMVIRGLHAADIWALIKDVVKSLVGSKRS